ncbi:MULTISPECIES: Exc2 family lipoprotein [Edwardsiella]|uniref:Exc2 family lipoprotein n=1 Tax=Edwardsiella anguillarum TaxID=1821960 RepID=A0ABY8SAK7_9GAMM|nr:MULTISPECIES: Exc2 family lipoprotein [Edwardsiella]AKR77932.1 Exc2 family lipoprotein [Edwardsiella sp. LADL05-105]UOU77629.1 Exc2 family lipoprotein [Edwardsiella anguillarum]WHP78866.1 Exc2 family lipoprotein [Edwardsiella anguillarum]WHP82267.1 Exc2 family lipoprotein [Edwardsiella anguillarum]WHP86067.1 Exc2 family lipoprotein [Edwardsiella anguillarum]
MNRQHLFFLCILSSAPLLLSACAQPESSAARHAKHLSYASDDNFAPHYRTKLYDSYQSSIPFLQQFWELGKKDRAAAITQAQQQQRIDEFKSQAFLTRINGKEHFAGKAYNSYSHREQKWRQAMSDAIIQTYLDGYHGIK